MEYLGDPLEKEFYQPNLLEAVAATEDTIPEDFILDDLQERFYNIFEKERINLSREYLLNPKKVLDTRIRVFHKDGKVSFRPEVLVENSDYFLTFREYIEFKSKDPNFNYLNIGRYQAWVPLKKYRKQYFRNLLRDVRFPYAASYLSIDENIENQFSYSKKTLAGAKKLLNGFLSSGIPPY